MSLFYRLLLSLVLLFAICVSAIAYLLIDEAKNRLEEIQLQQVKTMVKSLGEGSVNALVIKDYELLEGWLMASNSIDNFAYAYFSRQNGLIISHTDPDQVAKKSQVIMNGEKLLLRETNFLNRPVREVVYAINLGSKHIANAHLAYFLDTKSLYSVDLMSRLIELLLYALVFLSLISIYILRWALKPIESLTSIMQNISENKDFSLRADKSRDDEIGLLVNEFNNMLEQIQLRDRELIDEKNHVKESAEDIFVANKELQKEISERAEVENKLRELSATLEQRVVDRTKKLEELNKVVSDTSRLAGMAEVANGVLHNVGNVLNSVNVSSSVIRDKLQHSSVGGLSKLDDLLEQHKNGVGDFISKDEKGKQVPEYIKLLSKKLLKEQTDFYLELDCLDKNIEHIKNIVVTQQSYAGSYGIEELVDLEELLSYALKISLDNAGSKGIEIVKEYNEVPILQLDKNKLMQVLINILNNAKHALLDSNVEIKKLTLSILVVDKRIVLEIIDTGIGISQADMPHIFEYGYTKKKRGHGFGLHNSAIIMKELGGEISAFSQGEGKGACFTLTLPIKQ